MSDEAALLAAIIAHPDEDTPRLMYADWLDENGNPERAEFIRLQIEIANLPNNESNRLRRQQIQDRIEYSLKWFSADWLGTLAWVVSNVSYERGFVNDVFIPPDRLIAYHDRIFQAFPVRSLVVTRHVPHAEAADLRADQLQLLATWPELKRLSMLSVSGHAIGDRGASILAECPHLSNLSRLWLDRCAIGDEGVLAIVRSPYLENLTLLSLDQNEMGVEGMIALARSPHFPKLKALSLVCALHELEDRYTEAVQLLTERFGDGFSHSPWD